jgi:hypothetical protein
MVEFYKLKLSGRPLIRATGDEPGFSQAVTALILDLGSTQFRDR